MYFLASGNWVLLISGTGNSLVMSTPERSESVLA